MLEIKFEKEKNRAIALDGTQIIGECNFIKSVDKWNIVHTGVDQDYQGQGIARKLVDYVSENAKIYHKTVIADYSYAKRILEKYKR